MSAGRGAEPPGVEGRALFRHDQAMVWNDIRFTFARWHDRVIAAVVVLAIVAVIRSMLLRLPSPGPVVFGMAIVIALGAARLIASRLAYHASDGVLAAAALHPKARRGYAARWHGIGLAVVIAPLLIAAPASAAHGLAGYGVGVAVGALQGRIGWRRSATTARSGWTLRAMARDWRAGAAAGAGVLALLAVARLADGAAPVPLVIAATLAGALMLTPVDHAVVSFMSLGGHRTAGIVRYHARGLPAFAALAAGAAAMLGGLAAALLAGASLAAVLLLLTLRVLCYRLHGRRAADLLAGAFVGLLLSVAYAMPPALVPVAAAILWSLQRRAHARRWLLA